MKTIAVSNGDIQLDQGQIQFVRGNNKLVQDLNRWLKEPLGTGPTTPGFGSTLPGIVGMGQNHGIESTVENEILRVLQLYQGQQILDLQQSQTRAQVANWSRNEVIQSINSVNVTRYNDTFYASVSLTTLGNNTITLGITSDNNGVNINNG